MNNTSSMTYAVGLGRWGGGFQQDMNGELTGLSLTRGSVNIGAKAQPQYTRTATLRQLIEALWR